ncbi:MAG: hypothetical protein IH946_04640 [Bacteroidetes bacterium]|nr:hypothetical protein [Bacteroidota bacterium]
MKGYLYYSPNLGKSLLKVFDDEAGYEVTGFGPIHAKFEYGLSDKIGFGLVINYVTFGAEWTHQDLFSSIVYDDKTTFSSIAFNFRMNIHFATTEKLDAYWGVGAGYRTGKWKFDRRFRGYSHRTGRLHDWDLRAALLGGRISGEPY